MNNRAYLWIALAILFALGLDWLIFDWSGLIFTGKQLWRLVEWLAFWR